MPELTEGNTDDPIVATYEIRKSFDKFEALKGITLSVSSGQVVCIVGPSGGGKSTFLRTLNGLETIDEGRIVITGVQLPGTKKDVQNVRREVGMVFQSFNLFGHMSVRDNITLAPITARGVSRGRPMSGQKSYSSGSGSRIRSTNIPANYPVASSNGWRSPERWRWSPAS